MGFSNKIILADVSTVLNTETGKREKKIVNETEVFADRQEVGLQEYYQAQLTKIQLTAVYEIPAHMYHGERYLITDNRTKLYEITRAAKGRSLAYIRLPVQLSTEKGLL